MSPKPKRKAKTIDEYLAPIAADKRAALQMLRKAIRAAAPKAQECISYDIPAFRLDGKFQVAFGAAVKHCSFSPGSLPLEVHKNEIKNYDTSKGTLRFPPDKPLPAALVRKLVKVRVAQVLGRRGLTK
jgi:uncharacterized protein YdhG (YjbR/CyaY superfamily)